MNEFQIGVLLVLSLLMFLLGIGVGVSLTCRDMNVRPNMDATVVKVEYEPSITFDRQVGEARPRFRYTIRSCGNLVRVFSDRVLTAGDLVDVVRR